MTSEKNNREEIKGLEKRLKNLKQESKENESSKIPMVPASIVIAGILIAGAMLFSNNAAGSVAQNPTGNQPTQQPPTGSTDAVRPVTVEDHIRGNPDAPVKIVEYSDFECPFCKRFHTTMQQVMDEYGEDGKVAWVYRHFPLDQLHPVKARQEAVVSECINEIAGNDAFWDFADRFFELTPSNNQTDVDTVLPQIVAELGIDQQQINECVQSGRYDDHIQEDIDNAIATGGRGTPWSVVVSESGKTFPLSGAQPLTAVQQLINFALDS